MNQVLNKSLPKFSSKKFMIYAMAIIIAVLTSLLVYISREVSSQQSFSTTETRADEINSQGEPEHVVSENVLFNIDPFSILREIEKTGKKSEEQYGESASNPTFTPTPTLNPFQIEYQCYKKYLTKYPCILGHYADNPVPGTNACFMRYHPKCRIPRSNGEDFSERPIPTEYQEYCKYVPNQGIWCNFPPNKCIYNNISDCNEDHWKFQAKICGCNTCGSATLNGKDTGFGNKYTCSIKCNSGIQRSYDKSTGYNQNECDDLANEICCDHYIKL